MAIVHALQIKNSKTVLKKKKHTAGNIKVNLGTMAKRFSLFFVILWICVETPRFYNEATVVFILVYQ